MQRETIDERQKQRAKKGIYHIQHVNNFHYQLKDWIERFQGEPLNWFRWLELGKALAFEKRVKQMLISASQKSLHITVYMFGKSIA